MIRSRWLTSFAEEIARKQTNKKTLSDFTEQMFMRQRTLLEFARRETESTEAVSSGCQVPPAKMARLELTNLCLPPRGPASLVGRPRGTTKYAVRRVPDSTIDATLEAIRQVNGDGDTMARLWEHWEIFRSLNRGVADSDDALLFLFIVDIWQQGIKNILLPVLPAADPRGLFARPDSYFGSFDRRRDAMAESYGCSGGSRARSGRSY